MTVTSEADNDDKSRVEQGHNQLVIRHGHNNASIYSRNSSKSTRRTSSTSLSGGYLGRPSKYIQVYILDLFRPAFLVGEILICWAKSGRIERNNSAAYPVIGKVPGAICSIGRENRKRPGNSGPWSREPEDGERNEFA